jgi:hypothetical protein
VLIGTNGYLDLDLGDTSVDQKVYHFMIGSLLYLCASRPDITLSVCMCSRFQAALKDYHLRAVKRIMRYLVLTPNLGLWYSKGSLLSSLDIWMPIMPDAKWIGRVPLGHVNSLDSHLSLGLQRNRIPLSYPQPKRSMSPPVVVVHNYFGCDKLSRIMITLRTIFHVYVIMRVSSRLLITLMSILELNT